MSNENCDSCLCASLYRFDRSHLSGRLVDGKILLERLEVEVLCHREWLFFGWWLGLVFTLHCALPEVRVESCHPRLINLNPQSEKTSEKSAFK